MENEKGDMSIMKKMCFLLAALFVAAGLFAGSVRTFDNFGRGGVPVLVPRVQKYEPGEGVDSFAYRTTPTDPRDEDPAARASLSRLSSADPRVAERWEVYVAGIELGNAFGELVDAAEQKRRFDAAYKFRAAQGMKPYPEPEDFYAALERGIPESSGCAVGVDRLAMILCDADDIGMVRWE